LRNLVALQQSQARAPQAVALIASNILPFVAGYPAISRSSGRR
jgi:hypothetical protein